MTYLVGLASLTALHGRKFDRVGFRVDTVGARRDYALVQFLQCLSGGLTQQSLQGAHILLADLGSLRINLRSWVDILLDLRVGVSSRSMSTLRSN